jgi:hypothetical protein
MSFQYLPTAQTGKKLRAGEPRRRCVWPRFIGIIFDQIAVEPI